MSLKSTPGSGKSGTSRTRVVRSMPATRARLLDEAAGVAPEEKVGELLGVLREPLEVAADAIAGGARVVIHDDVLATGGTVEAIAGLVEHLGGTVVGVNFVIELSFLGGRERLAKYDLFALIKY